MIRLPKSVRAWGSAAFAATLKAELEALPANLLPLDKGVTPGSYVDTAPVVVMVISSAADTHGLRIRAGVFFSEVVVNCGCGDDPMVQPAYCELRVDIDRATAVAVLAVVAD